MIPTLRAGKIPDAIASMTCSSTIFVEINRLSGKIADAMAYLTRLLSMWFRVNSLSGT